jgi:hypothetical protein
VRTAPPSCARRTRRTTAARPPILRFARDRAKRAPEAVFDAYREREYYGSLTDAVIGVCERYELDVRAFNAAMTGEAAQIAEREEAFADPLSRPVDLTVGADERHLTRVFAAHAHRLFLLTCPDQEFLSAVEAIDALVRASHTNRFNKTTPGWPSVVGYADRALREHGVPWRAERTRFEWVGDPAVAETVFQPALAALSDRRLDGARVEFERALRGLRRGGSDANEQAVGDAGKAVESALDRLLVENALQANEKDGAKRRWQRLCEADVLPTWSEHLVLGASLPRNRVAAHGRGVEPRRVAEATATAAVGAAAVAITLLAAHLPVLESTPLHRTEPPNY